MLSAIAARKARLGLTDSQQKSHPIPEVPTQSPPSSVQSSPPPPSKPNSKRKLVAQFSNTSKRKQNKTAHIKERGRYFEGDTFERQEDVIIVEDSDSDSEDLDQVDDAAVKPSTSKPVASSRWSPSIPMNDSSDEESHTEEAERECSPVVTLPPATPNPQYSVLSTFLPSLDKNVFHLSFDEVSYLGGSISGEETIVLIVLDSAQTLALLGTYAFVVLHGYVSLSGVTLTAGRKSHRVFAPRSSPMPILRCLSGVSGSEAAFLPERFRSLSKHDGAVIVLQEIRTGVQGLGSICRTFDRVFEPLHAQKTENEGRLLPNVHLLSHQSRDIQPFLLPSSWEIALSSVLPSRSHEVSSVKPIVCLVRGPKKTGKSTFSRTLLNHLSTRYRKVAFLECDPGQSEFTPAGMVALNIIERPVFGPPFTHPTIPNFAHYIGSASPRSSPSHYLSAIQSLLESYRLDVQLPVDPEEMDVAEDDRIADLIPLVVNTMGWTKGLGADLALRIENMVEPTDVFQIEEPVHNIGWSVPHLPAPHSQENFEGHNRKIHVLEPVPITALSTSYSPADHRTLSILSYFHSLFPSSSLPRHRQVTVTTWNTNLPLCAYPPYEVDWTVAFEKITLIGAGTEDVVPSEIRQVLNGAVVGLLCCEPGTIDMDSDISTPTRDRFRSDIPYIQGSPAPSPSTSICHGLALIRAVSPTSPHMHIVTPLPPHILTKSRVVVKGDLELPIWGMLDFRIDFDEGKGRAAGSETVPYLQWGKKEGLGAERRRVRRNLMRKGQM